MARSRRCLNCNAVIGKANFCPRCGQENTDRRLTLQQFLKDFLGEYFTFDSKFVHSVVPLVTRPGHLTSEYLAGRRIRYILPLRLYLFTTFLFFFVLTVQNRIDQSGTEAGAAARKQSAADSLRRGISARAPSLNSAEQKGLAEAITSTFDLTPKAAADSGHIVIMWNDSTTTGAVGYLRRKAEFINSRGKEGMRLFWCRSCFP